MKKHKDNLFHEKFRLLNSQEHSEDIKWSLSSSSEYESTSCNEKNNNLDRLRNRKRKRKKKVPKNVSNLDITYTDTSKDHESNKNIETSPILISKRTENKPISPILLSVFPPKRDIDTSPILSKKCLHPKSPILNFKTGSPGYAEKVRKRLCYEKSNIKKVNCSTGQQNSNITIEDEHKNDGQTADIEEKVLNNRDVNILKSETNSMTINSSDSTKDMLKEKVKNFFDSHFSSGNTSQHISDTPTPTDISRNEEIDILSCKTQALTNIQSVKLETTNNTFSDISYCDKTVKKVKYKKGGLAYRLNGLLKKQNAHISLWHHERFLAGNSNFVIPKEDIILFRIQKIDFKYGCYFIHAMDCDSEKYFILINNKYVNCNIVVDSVFKLYEPYKILTIEEDFKIIINVCKYECIIIKE